MKKNAQNGNAKNVQTVFLLVLTTVVGLSIAAYFWLIQGGMPQFGTRNATASPRLNLPTSASPLTQLPPPTTSPPPPAASPSPWIPIIENPRQVPDITQLVQTIESNSYFSCAGTAINDQFVGSGQTHLIKENIKWGRLSNICVKPLYFVVHWVGKWIDASSIKNTIEGNGASCQFLTDKDQTWALMKLYPDRVERAACTGNRSNLVALNIEINGVCFDQALAGQFTPDTVPDESYADFGGDVDAICQHFAKNSSERTDEKYPNVRVSQRQAELEIMTKNAIDIACKSRRIYRIPVDHVIGHFEIPQKYTKNLKFDPGKEYIKYFRTRLAQECPIPEDE